MERDKEGVGSETFRLGVGALIVASSGRVLAMERADVPDAWQLPQGGVEAGEALTAAILREIHEELGIVSAELTLLAEHPLFLGYELPPELQHPKTGRGQCHRWFLFQIAPDARPITATGTEVGRHRWVPMEDLVANAVGFRRPVYQELARYFADHLRRNTEAEERDRGWSTR